MVKVKEVVVRVDFVHPPPLRIPDWSALRPPPNRKVRTLRFQISSRRFSQTPMRPLPHSWVLWPKLRASAANRSARMITTGGDHRTTGKNMRKSEVCQRAEVGGEDDELIASAIADQHRDRESGQRPVEGAEKLPACHGNTPSAGSPAGR